MSTPHKLNVFVTRRDGRLTFDRSKGFAPCMISCDVMPAAPDLQLVPAIKTIYAESDFDNAVEVIQENCNDSVYMDAAKILEADAGWREWAEDELAKQAEMHAVDAVKARAEV